MDKRSFLKSVDELNNTALNISSLATSISRIEVREATEAAKEKIKGTDKKMPKITVKNSVADPVMAKAEELHSLVNSSAKAFYKSNKQAGKSGEKYSLPVFEDVSGLYTKRHSFTGTKEELLDLIISQGVRFGNELQKHIGTKVYHENGQVWNKSSTDKSRFKKMKDSLVEIANIVS